MNNDQSKYVHRVQLRGGIINLLSSKCRSRGICQLSQLWWKVVPGQPLVCSQSDSKLQRAFTANLYSNKTHLWWAAGHHVLPNSNRVLSFSAQWITHTLSILKSCFSVVPTSNKQGFQLVVGFHKPISFLFSFHKARKQLLRATVEEVEEGMQEATESLFERLVWMLL